MFRNSLRLSYDLAQKQLFGKLHLNLMSELCTAKPCPPKALVILAHGAEESEAVIIVDVLRRAGVNVTVAGLHNRNPIKTMNSVEIVPDQSLYDVCDIKFNAVVLPGGKDGVEALSQSKMVREVLHSHEKCERIIGAICAAPLVLNAHGIYKGRQLTSYPGLKDQLMKNYKFRTSPNVIVDNELITSKGPATAFEFALRLAYLLMTTETKTKPKQVADEMLLPLATIETKK